MNRASRIIFAGVTLYASWMAMMAVHESGHVLGALVGGGRVRRVVIPLAGFSRTDIDPNPSPRLEIWGGPLWGSAIPLLGWLLVRNGIATPFKTSIEFFTGLCLVANGAYMGMGWTMRAGDAAELIKLGTPIWLLIAFGLPALICGFYIWHGLGRTERIFKA